MSKQRITSEIEQELERVKLRFAQRTEALRSDMGLTQEGFAALAGFSQAAAYKWFRGKSLPGGDALYLISKATGKSIDWLLSGKTPTKEFVTSPNVILASQVKEMPEAKLEDYYAAPLLEGKIAAGTGRALSESEIQSLVWIRTAPAQNVSVSDDSLIVDLDDGRTISVPLAWFPRLLNGSEEERDNWRFIGRGEGIHWPQLDEDISVEGIISGRPSGESQPSFKRWLEARQKSTSAGG